MRSFLLVVAAALVVLLIAISSDMAQSARANSHRVLVAIQR